MSKRVPLVLVSICALAACTVGDLPGDNNGTDGPDAAPPVSEKQWVPITSQTELITGASFALDGQGRINAVVNGSLMYWDGAAWMLLAAPPAGQSIEHFQIKNGLVYALLDTGAGKQICEWINNTWEPRTAVADTYAGGFSVHGAEPKIFAVLQDATGRLIAQCDLLGCTPATPVADISAVDFDCNGCGGGGGGGGGGAGPVFHAQLGDQVASSTGNAAWSPETVQISGLGPVIHAETEIYVEIDDAIAMYNSTNQQFDMLTGAFPNMLDFASNPAGDWMALADGIVCAYQ